MSNQLFAILTGRIPIQLLAACMLASVSVANPPEVSPGAKRLLGAAEAIRASTPAPDLAQTIARGWLATSTAAIGGNPPAGPPDSVTANPERMAIWAIACVESAAAAPPGADGTAYAESQVELIARLLGDVARTDTEPPNPAALAKVLYLGGELAYARGDLEAARTLATRSGETMDWSHNVLVAETGSLALLLARLNMCSELERMAANAPSEQMVEIIVASATSSNCAETTKTLLEHPRLITHRREILLLKELREVRAATAVSDLITLHPSVTDSPKGRLMASQGLLAGGRLEEGMKLLGDPSIIQRMGGKDRIATLSAMASGEALQQQWAKARQLLQPVASNQLGLYAIIELEGQMLEAGAIQPPNVLKGLISFASIYTFALDPMMPLVGQRPTRLERVLEALVRSDRIELVMTLLKPKFQAVGQTSDLWLEQRIGVIANALVRAEYSGIEAWKTLILESGQLRTVDSQVRALSVLATCWAAAHPSDDLPSELRDAITEMIETITLRDMPTIPDSER